jgi:RNA recognition motif-containing protein
MAVFCQGFSLPAPKEVFESALGAYGQIVGVTIKTNKGGTNFAITNFSTKEAAAAAVAAGPIQINGTDCNVVVSTANARLTSASVGIGSSHNKGSASLDGLDGTDGFAIFCQGFPQGTCAEEIKSAFGELEIRSISLHAEDTSRPHAYIQFASPFAALAAVSAGANVGGKKCRVELQKPKAETRKGDTLSKSKSKSKSKHTADQTVVQTTSSDRPDRMRKPGKFSQRDTSGCTVFCSGFPKGTTAQEFRTAFSEHIHDLQMMEGLERAFAFARFASAQSAQRAVNAGATIGTKKCRVEVQTGPRDTQKTGPRKAASGKSTGTGENNNAGWGGTDEDIRGVPLVKGKGKGPNEGNERNERNERNSVGKKAANDKGRGKQPAGSRAARNGIAGEGGERQAGKNSKKTSTKVERQFHERDPTGW